MNNSKHVNLREQVTLQPMDEASLCLMGGAVSRFALHPECVHYCKRYKSLVHEVTLAVKREYLINIWI